MHASIRLSLPTFVLVFIISTAYFSYEAGRAQNGRAPQFVASCTPAPPGMVAWWDAEGSGRDLRGENVGVLQNSATFAAGKVGQAFAFGGGADSVLVPDGAALNPTAQITLDAWVFPTADGGASDVVSIILNKELSTTNVQYEVGRKNTTGCPSGSGIATGNFAFFLRGVTLPDNCGGWVDGGAQLPLNSWSHVALTYDGSNVNSYVNGSLARQVAASGAIQTANGSFLIGARSALSGWVGLIDEPEVFNRALSATEVSNIFLADSAGKCKPRCATAPSGLVSWWDADDDPFDRQGTNHGTLVGGATFANGKVGRAFAFDGATGMVTVPDNSSLGMTSSYSFDAWVFYLPNSFDQVIAVRTDPSFTGHDIELKLEGSSTNNLTVNHNRTNGGTIASVNFPVVPQNVWFHLGVVFDGTKVHAFYNGVEQTPTSGDGSIGAPLYTNRGWVFGRTDHSAFGSQGKFKGELDEIELFNRALSASEIQAINNAASSGKCKLCLAPPSGMIGWWNGDANPNDSSGNSNNGTLQGNSTLALGKVGQSFNFQLPVSGFSYLSVPDNPSLHPTQVTIDAWMKMSANTNFNTVISKGCSTCFQESYALSTLGNNPRFYTTHGGSEDFIAGPDLTDPFGWHHIAGTYDGTTKRLYVDGVEVANRVIGTPMDYDNTGTVPLTIGADWEFGGPAHQFEGQLDEVEVFNRALSPSEIQSLVAAGASGKCKIACVPPPATMVAWWPASGTANDIQGSNQGTLQNGATFASGKVGQAFSFNGVNQSLDTSASPTTDFNFGASDLTIDAWVNFTASPVSPIIFATPQSQPLAQLRISNSKGEFFIRDDSGNQIDVIGTTNLNDGVWHHLAGVRQGTTGTLYVDGAPQNSMPNPAFGSITSTCGFALIGGNNSGVNCGAPATENFFNGLIDEVEVFKRALSVSEIQAIFSADRAGKCKFATSGSTTTTAFAGDTTITLGNGSTPGTNTYQTRDANSVGPMPLGYNSPLHVANLSTTASLLGTTRICFNLQAGEFASAPFQQLRILHLEGNDLINRTSFSQSSTRTLCADVTSLSPFVIAQNTNAPTAANGRVSGTITDASGAPVAGITISLNGAESRETITDSQGNYSFDNVETNGFYTVTPSRANYSFSPASRSFSALGVHTEASFTASPNGDNANAIDTTEFFVRQQYLDFLGREPDGPGFNGWVNTIRNCAAGNPSCDRVHVSEMFFRSAEFQERGYFVYRFYSTALGRKPDYAEFMPDMARVSGFLTDEQLAAAKTQFAGDFTARPAFVNQYGMLTNSQYVDALSASAGVSLSNRQSLIDSLNAGTMTRAQTLRQIAESNEVYAKYYNQAFVVMEYFGYLRRDPDALYLNWIQVLDANPTDSRRMVEGFVDATEYRNRFRQ